MKSVLTFLILLILLAFFLPELASTKTGNDFLKSQLKKRAGIEVDSLHLSWKGPQIIQGVSIAKKGRRIVAKELIIEKRTFTFKDVALWVDGHHLKGDEISLTLPQKGISIYLLNFSFETLQIPDMMLKLGKMRWQNF